MRNYIVRAIIRKEFINTYSVEADNLRAALQDIKLQVHEHGDSARRCVKSAVIEDSTDFVEFDEYGIQAENPLVPAAELDDALEECGVYDTDGMGYGEESLDFKFNALRNSHANDADFLRQLSGWLAKVDIGDPLQN